MGEGRNGLAFFNNSACFNNLTFNFCGLLCQAGASKDENDSTDSDLEVLAMAAGREVVRNFLKRGRTVLKSFKSGKNRKFSPLSGKILRVLVDPPLTPSLVVVAAGELILINSSTLLEL